MLLAVGLGAACQSNGDNPKDGGSDDHINCGWIQ